MSYTSCRSLDVSGNLSSTQLTSNVKNIKVSDSDSDIYLFDHIITNILHNYQFCSEYKRLIGQGDLHQDNGMSLAWRPPWRYIIIVTYNIQYNI